jgi:hypothetical protein
MLWFYPIAHAQEPLWEPYIGRVSTRSSSRDGLQQTVELVLRSDALATRLHISRVRVGPVRSPPFRER